MLIVGAGAGGLTAAVTAAEVGLDVVVAEKSRYFGGSSALSGGWIWVPCNPAARRDGIEDSLEKAELYVRSQTAHCFDPERVRAYLENGPRMVEFLERRTSVHFTADHTFADYFPDDPGGMSGGRTLVASPFDGRDLGENLANLMPPLRQQTFLGMSIGSGAQLKHFLNVTRSLRSCAFVAKALLQYGLDLAIHGRGVHLYNGNALMGRLAKSAIEKNVRILLATPAIELTQEGGAVMGAVLEHCGRRLEVRARLGVVLASGGFSRDPEKRARYLPRELAVSVAPEENSGDGIRLAEALGACLRGETLAAAYTAVFSKFVAANETVSLYPHFADRAKPGIIAVLSDGKRFCNESNSYHHVAEAMVSRRIDGISRKAFFIADHRALRRYGLGAVRPAPLPIGPYTKSGYLVRAGSLRELAMQIGVDAEPLEATIAEFNTHAIDGRDPLFGRGQSSYNTFQGDYSHAPNPCLAPLTTPPFYAVEVISGDMATFIGLVVSPKAEVLDQRGVPIAGLYAVGNDAANVFAGACLGGGITIGPAMVFGFIAAKALEAAFSGEVASLR